MTIKEAVVARVTALLTERSMRPVELARRVSLTPSTVYSFLNAFTCCGLRDCLADSNEG